ncbi:MAG: hypothetical protein LBU74_00050 [Methanobacteriaceae archaeon]|nr:hypothetical protein [Candidatus Methanorudis spinitermitis]
MALFGVCCIGLIILFILGALSPDSMIPGNSSESKIYENEYISFKYPESFVDISFFYYHGDGEYLFYSMFVDFEENGMIVSCEEIEASQVPTFLDEYRDYVNSLQRDEVKNFTIEKIDFKGIPSIKIIDEMYKENEGGKYRLSVAFIHNDKFYLFYFGSNNLSTLNHYYDLLKSSITLK